MDYTAAIAELKTLSNPTVEQIRDIVQRTDMSIPNGNSVLLYSGSIAEVGLEVISAHDVVTEIAKANSSVSIIDNTDVGLLLESKVLEDRLLGALFPVSSSWTNQGSCIR